MKILRRTFITTYSGYYFQRKVIYGENFSGDQKVATSPDKNNKDIH